MKSIKEMNSTEITSLLTELKEIMEAGSASAHVKTVLERVHPKERPNMVLTGIMADVIAGAAYEKLGRGDEDGFEEMGEVDEALGLPEGALSKALSI